MSQWKKVKLSELGEIVGGATPSTKREDYYNGDIPWLTPKDLAGYSGRYISRGERSITKAGLDSCSAKLMPKHSILFTSRAPIGYVAISENEICTNQGFKSIVPNENTNYRFLYYLLKYNKEKIESMGSGTTFKEVSGAVMKSVEVEVPELEEQKAIAKVLSSIDDQIELYNRISKNLEAQAEAIFKSWFVDFEPFQDDEFIDSELGQIPKGWKIGKLGEVISTNCESYKQSDNWRFVNYLDTGNITQNVIEKIQFIDLLSEKLPSRARRKVKYGDIVFSSVRPNQKHFGIIMNPLDNMLVSTGFIVISGLYNYFTYYFLTQQHITDMLHTIAEQAVSTYPSIKSSDIENLVTVLPPESVVKEFSEAMSTFNRAISLYRKQIQTLVNIGNSLLPKLLSREISVPLEV